MRIYKLKGGIFHLLDLNEKRNLINKNDVIQINYSVIEVEKNSHYHNLIKRGLRGEITNDNGWNETIQGLNSDVKRFVKNYVLKEVPNIDSDLKTQNDYFETTSFKTKLKFR